MYEWNGARWYFATEGNRDLFAKDPEKYAPQYGGFCAYAVSKGAKADIDPNSWSIVDDKLYLLYGEGVKKIWNQNSSGHIKTADQIWERMR